MAYAKRYVGGFVDLPSQTTAIDSTFLNAVEAALLKIFDTDPTVDGQVAQWISASTKYGPALILNKNVDPSAAIIKSKLDFSGANGIVNADVAGAAAIAKSKLAALAIAQSDMASGNKVTASSMAGGPPGGPADGDIWIATTVDGVGTCWAFRYNNAEATYKWEFIGGPPLFAGPAGSLSSSSTVYVDLTTGPTLTAPRAGEYLVDFSIFVQNTAFTSAYNLNAEVVFSTAGTGQQWDIFVATSVFAGGRGGGSEKRTGIAASETLKIQVKGSNTHTSAFNNASLALTPVRII